MTRVLGIDLGTYSIKIAELELSRNSREVVGLYEIPRSSNETLDTLLEQFFAQSGVSPEKIAVGLGRAPVFLKNLELPFSDRTRVNAAVRSDLEDSLPFEITDHIIDIQPLGRVGKTYSFNIGLTPSEPVKFLNQTFEKIGKAPQGYFLESEALGQLALHQQLPQASPDAQTAYALIDVGFERTQMSICVGTLQDPWKGRSKAESQTRVMDFRATEHGLREVISWIEKTKGITFEEAKQWLTHRATIKNSSEDTRALSDQLSDEIKTAFRPLVVEIYQFLQHFKSISPKPLTAIYLTGGMSHIQGLREFFSEEFHYPVFHWPIFLGFNTDKVTLSEDRERSFAVALALAFRFAQKKSLGWLNFRRSAQSQKNIITQALKNTFPPERRPLVFSALAFFAFLYSYAPTAKYFINEQIKAAEKSVINEFRRMDRDLGKRSEKFVSDPKRAREVFLAENKKLSEKSADSFRARLENAPQTNEKMGKPRSQLLLDLSSALSEIPGSKLSLFEATTKGSDSTQLNIKASLQMESTASADPTKLQAALLTKLSPSAGYQELKIQPANSGFDLSYQWRQPDPTPSSPKGDNKK